MDGSGADQFFEPILGEQNTSFRRLKTIPIFSVHLLISCIISLTGIILAAGWAPEQRCRAYFIMMYLRAAFWFVTLIFDHIVKWIHENHRLVGYHDMHRSTKMIRGTPFIIVSLWTTTLMAIQTMLHQYYGENFWEHCLADHFSTPVSYVTAFALVETVILAITHFSYMAKVKQFNSVMPEPDALRENNDGRRSIGFTQRGAGIVELLDKQADLIDFYKDQLERNIQAMLAINNAVVRIQATEE